MKTATTKSVIAGQSVRIGSTPVVVGRNHCVAAPKVSLVRNGEIVDAIEVRCGCGEVIVLDCVYENADSNDS